MPEGPEVRRVGNLLESAVDRTITGATVLSGRYTRTKIQGLEQLQGSLIKRVIVKGKLLVFVLQDSTNVFAALSTLGMSGWWYRLNDRNTLPARVAKHIRLSIELDDGSRLVYVDTRNFGTFKITALELATAKLGALGADILAPPILWSTAQAEFLLRVDKYAKKQTVAEALLDQRIAAGVGNYIRADAMYLSAISPTRLMSELSKDELQRLWAASCRVAAFAWENVHPLEPNMTFDTVCYAKPTSPKGNPIDTYKDRNGRTVWYCPMEQATQ